MKNGDNGNGNGRHTEASDRQAYVLQHTPTILAALLIRRNSTKPVEMIDSAMSCAERIYDLVHGIDVPAEAMLSKPVSAPS